MAGGRVSGKEVLTNELNVFIAHPLAFIVSIKAAISGMVTDPCAISCWCIITQHTTVPAANCLSQSGMTEFTVLSQIPSLYVAVWVACGICFGDEFKSTF